MNKRIYKKITKRKLNTPTKFVATGGFLTPYACPGCDMLYRYQMAYEANSCPNCGQRLIWWNVFEHG